MKLLYIVGGMLSLSLSTLFAQSISEECQQLEEKVTEAVDKCTDTQDIDFEKCFNRDPNNAKLLEQRKEVCTKAEHGT